MGGFIVSLELINRKMGSSLPRHQQYQQLGSESTQRLAVDQLNLFARFHISNLGRTRMQTFQNSRETAWVIPGSSSFTLANETKRGKSLSFSLKLK